MDSELLNILIECVNEIEGSTLYDIERETNSYVTFSKPPFVNNVEIDYSTYFYEKSNDTFLSKINTDTKRINEIYKCKIRNTKIELL